MIPMEDALLKFETLDPEVVFTVNSDRFTNPLQYLKNKYGTGFDDVVILIIIGDLITSDLVDYLTQEKQLAEAEAITAAKELTDMVLEPLARRLLFLNSDPDKVGITVAQEKEVLRRIFSENLMLELSDSFVVKNALNYRIFDLLEKDLNFKRELERLMYENHESVTEKSITVDGKPDTGTIANWLRDFISRKGTGNFDTIILSDYLTNTVNTKSLSSAEREKLYDLLTAYRNLKFFPDSVQDKPLEEWRIIPFDKPIAKAKKEIKKSPPLPPAELPDINSKLSQYDWSKIAGIERRALLEELGVSSRDFNKWLAEKK